MPNERAIVSAPGCALYVYALLTAELVREMA
jgi:hypothetical protein